MKSSRLTIVSHELGQEEAGCMMSELFTRSTTLSPHYSYCLVIKDPANSNYVYRIRLIIEETGTTNHEYQPLQAIWQLMTPICVPMLEKPSPHPWPLAHLLDK